MLSKSGAKVLLFFESCVPQFWNGTCVRRFHELYGVVNSTPRNMKIAREFGITHRAMRFVKLIILHPLEIRRQTVLFRECLQQSLLLQGAKKFIFCHLSTPEAGMLGTTCP